MRESYGLRKLINTTEELIGKDITNSDPEFDAWEVKTKQFFVSQYGSDSFMIKKFDEISFYSFIPRSMPKDEAYRMSVEACRDGLIRTKGILEACLEEIQEDLKKPNEYEIANNAIVRNIIFISHNTSDKPVAEMLREFLINIGVKDEMVFCSSIPGNDVDEKISSEVKKRLKESSIIILILSGKYLQSPYCLNEAGIAWYLGDDVLTIPICLPEIKHDDMRGFYNDDYKLRKLDDFGDMSYIYDSIHKKINTEMKTVAVINREIGRLQEKYELYLKQRQYGIKEMDSSIKIDLDKSEGVLLVYAAADSGGMIILTMGVFGRVGAMLSTCNFSFPVKDSAREGARWKAVVEKLEKYGFVETRNGDRRMFFLTDKGYEMADKIKEEWKIDTNENPEQYL